MTNLSFNALRPTNRAFFVSMAERARFKLFDRVYPAWYGYDALVFDAMSRADRFTN